MKLTTFLDSLSLSSSTVNVIFSVSLRHLKDLAAIIQILCSSRFKQPQVLVSPLPEKDYSGGSEYSGDLNTDHLNTKLFENHILNGSLFKWSVSVVTIVLLLFPYFFRQKGYFHRFPLPWVCCPLSFSHYHVVFLVSLL